jgi:hypothetical protein
MKSTKILSQGSRSSDKDFNLRPLNYDVRCVCIIFSYMLSVGMHG